MEKIESGVYEGVVSSFTLAELIKVLREVLVALEGNYDPVDWNKQIETAFEAILNIPNITIIKHHAKKGGLPILFDDVVTEGIRIMKTFSGNVKIINDKKKHKKKYRHHGMFVVDAYHVKLAKELNCAKIATFDRDFEETQAEIMPLILHMDKSW